jgi:hypothetical protein
LSGSLKIEGCNTESVPENENYNKKYFFGPPMRAVWEYLRRELLRKFSIFDKNYFYEKKIIKRVFGTGLCSLFQRKTVAGELF